MKRQYYVYILTNRTKTVLYTGVTNNLRRRILEHKQGLVKGFTRKYRVHRLVYYEIEHNICEAIIREKRIKRWHRKWKMALIEKENPLWTDLYYSYLRKV